MTKTFYLTTPIYYVNDVPHIGHAYTTVAADVLARFQRLSGRSVFFLTGLDEHGQKVQQAAQAAGKPPQEYVDAMAPRFLDLWRLLEISYDDFVRTTQERHKQVVQNVLNRLYEKGEIYRHVYEGWYCLPCERFWTEKDLVEGRCPECHRPVDRIQEPNYFFRMSRYHEALRQYILDHPEFIQPPVRRNEVLGFLERPLGDLCISRPRTRLSWGIPLPFDPDYVTYVWLDALVNYISIPGYTVDETRFRQLWPADVHLLGKDILTTHAVYWSTLLMALGEPLPRTLFAHGWWTSEGEKMSKSRGNVVDPNRVVAEFGVSAFRYFLLREVPFGQDGDFSRAALIHRINSDLANDLGNLVSRTLALLARHTDGAIPQPGKAQPEDEAVAQAARDLFQGVSQAMAQLAFHQALIRIWEFLGHLNRYADQMAPWNLARDPAARPRLEQVLYTLAEGIRIAGIYLFPFMPATAREIFRKLGLPPESLETPLLREDGEGRRWGVLAPGQKVVKGPPLFPRIDLRQEAPSTKPASQPAEAQRTRDEKAPAQITIEEFSRLELRVGRIQAAEAIPGSRKLLKLQVDLGEEVRQVVAGIATRYRPEDLLGRQVVIVANLKPARLMGVESQGMLLAAGEKEVLGLVTLDQDVPPGTRIR